MKITVNMVIVTCRLDILIFDDNEIDFAKAITRMHKFAAPISNFTLAADLYALTQYGGGELVLTYYHDDAPGTAECQKSNCRMILGVRRALLPDMTDRSVLHRLPLR